MKHIIFSVSFFLLLSISVSTSAQLRYTGQWALHTSGSPTLNSGFNINMGVEKYFRNSIGSATVNIDYIRYSSFIKITDFNLSILSLSGSYFYSFERLIRPPFFINLGAGILLGTEIFEKKKLPKGVIQHSGSRFIYGFLFEPQFEYLISKKISIYIKPEIRYYLRTRFDNLFFSPGIGLKVYL